MTAIMKTRLVLTSEPHSKYEKAHGRGGVSCLKGKKKNGKCKRAVLRVRSAGSEDFFEIPDVEDAHVSEVEAEDAEI